MKKIQIPEVPMPKKIKLTQKERQRIQEKEWARMLEQFKTSKTNF